jgi:colicin import membrane protein
MKVLGVIWSALAAMALHPLAWSQQDISQGPEQVTADRLRIEQQRQIATVELNAQEQACQSKFVVTSCVQDVGRRRIAMLADLKRQEATLNDAERRKRGAEQLVRSVDKAAERANSDAELSALPTSTQLDRKMAQESKVSQHKSTGHHASVEINMPKTPANPAAVDIQNNRVAYSQRMEDARLRRVSRDKRLQERPKGGIALPVSP